MGRSEKFFIPCEAMVAWILKESVGARAKIQFVRTNGPHADVRESLNRKSKVFVARRSS